MALRMALRMSLGCPSDGLADGPQGRALVSNPCLRLGLCVMRGQFDDMLFEPLEEQQVFCLKVPNRNAGTGCDPEQCLYQQYDSLSGICKECHRITSTQFPIRVCRSEPSNVLAPCGPINRKSPHCTRLCVQRVHSTIRIHPE